MSRDGQTPRGLADTLLIRISAVIGIAACLGDLFMTYLLETWYPGFKPLFQPMSELGERGSPVAGITSAWWVIMGLMFILFGYGFHRAFSQHGKTARVAAWLLVLYGIGEGLGSALVPGTPGKAFRTPASLIHNLLGSMGMSAAVLLPFLIMKMYRSRQSPFVWRYAWFTTVAGILLLILFGIANLYHPDGSWISYSGLWQRLYMLTYYLFFIFLAILMLIRTGPPHTKPL